MLTHIRIRIKQKGKAVANAIACRELRPPLNVSAIAIKPINTHHKIRCFMGVFIFPLDAMVSITRAPESIEVIKNIQINTIAMKEVISGKGKLSRNL